MMTWQADVQCSMSEPHHHAAQRRASRPPPQHQSIVAALVLAVSSNLIKLKTMAACLVDSDLYYNHELAVYARP